MDMSESLTDADRAYDDWYHAPKPWKVASSTWELMHAAFVAGWSAARSTGEGCNDAAGSEVAQVRKVWI